MQFFYINLVIESDDRDKAQTIVSKNIFKQLTKKINKKTDCESTTYESQYRIWHVDAN